MTDMAEPFEKPGSSPPRVTSARSKNSNWAWPRLNGPKAKPTPVLLLRPPIDRPIRVGNQGTSRYSAPVEILGIGEIPKPELKAGS